MTHEDLELHAHKLGKLLSKIDEMEYEMKNDRNDGWVQEHFKQSLNKLRDHINKVLEN